MTTTKNAVNAIKAPVMPQVLLRSGQRTWRSSAHAPLKYRPKATNGFAMPLAERFFVVFSVTSALVGAFALFVGFVRSGSFAGFASLVVIRVTLVVEPFLDGALATDLFLPKLKAWVSQAVKSII